MRNIIFLLLLSLTLFSCKKAETEDQSDKLIGYWKLSSFSSNGVDTTIFEISQDTILDDCGDTLYFERSDGSGQTFLFDGRQNYYAVYSHWVKTIDYDASRNTCAIIFQTWKNDYRMDRGLWQLSSDGTTLTLLGPRAKKDVFHITMLDDTSLQCWWDNGSRHDEYTFARE